MLVTAVYTGGTQPFGLGTRYILALQGDDLQIRGPVDLDPNAIVATRPLVALELVGLADRFVLSTLDTARDRFIVGFANVTGMTVDGLERAILAEQSRVREEAARP